MILLKKITDLKTFIAKQRAVNRSVGFVPTMGALHEGHMSLLKMCKDQADTTVCSIFVNPTQFNDPNDFQKYPKTIADDILKLEHAQCDVLFLPSVEEMYPNGMQNNDEYKIGNLEKILEGEFRPGHFQGVSQVVHKLLNIVTPDKIFLGQKDFQQVLVIKHLITQKEIPVSVELGETLREPSGLAMSSRNVRLSDEDKLKATAIFKTMHFVKTHLNQTPIPRLIADANDMLLKGGFTKVDYVSIADANSLEPLYKWDGKRSLVVLVAAYISGVRLIDNLVIHSTAENIIT